MPEHLFAQLHGSDPGATRFSLAAGPVLNLQQWATLDRFMQRGETHENRLYCLQG